METQAEYATAAPPKSAIIALLADRPIAYHPMLAKVLGGVKQAIFVSQLLYWHGKGKRKDGFIWKTQEEWTEETGLSAAEQRTARKALKKQGVLEEQLKGVPATLHYRLDLQMLETCISSYEEPLDLDVKNLDNQMCRSLPTIPEITPETTTQITAERKTPPTADSPPTGEKHLERMRAKMGDTLFSVAAHTEQARAEAEHPDFTDATKDIDPWTDKPLKAFCVLVGQDYDCLKLSALKDWPKQLFAWAQSHELHIGPPTAPTPQETFQCIQGITQSEHAWKTFTSPRQPSFQETMDIMLSRLHNGQPWNATGKRNGNGRHDAQPARVERDRDEPDIIGAVVVPEHYARWEAAKAELAGAFGRQAVAQWLGRSRLLCYGDGHATVEVQDALCLDWVEGRWADAVCDELGASVRFVVAEVEVPAWANST